jgi:recombination protein RecA
MTGGSLMSKSTAIKLCPKLQKFSETIEKRTSIKGVFVTPKFQQEYIPTGSTILNLLIGGNRLPDRSFICPGWPKGTISEVFGRESSGKSTIAMTGMAHAIQMDGCGLYIDNECAVRDHYAMKIGVDFRPPQAGGSGMAMRAQPHTFEETETLVMAAALTGVDFIVVDSVAGLVPAREAKRDTSQQEAQS